MKSLETKIAEMQVGKDGRANLQPIHAVRGSVVNGKSWSQQKRMLWNTVVAQAAHVFVPCFPFPFNALLPGHALDPTLKDVAHRKNPLGRAWFYEILRRLETFGIRFHEKQHIFETSRVWCVCKELHPEMGSSFLSGIPRELRRDKNVTRCAAAIGMCLLWCSIGEGPTLSRATCQSVEHSVSGRYFCEVQHGCCPIEPLVAAKHRSTEHRSVPSYTSSYFQSPEGLSLRKRLERGLLRSKLLRLGSLCS